MNLTKIALLIGLTPLLTYANIQTTNLLTNPGAESTPLGTGWIYNNYAGVDSGTFDPGINPLSGAHDFYGGVGGGYGSSNIYQYDSILTQGITSADVTNGLYANISFNEQGLNQGVTSDDARIVLQFYDASGTELVPSGTGYVAPVYLVTPEIDSHGGLWTNYTESFLIPDGTASIAYDMQFILHQGVNIDSFVDDNILTVGSTYSAPTETVLTGGVPLSPTPEPSMYGVMLAGFGGLFVAVRRRNRKIGLSGFSR